MSNPGAASLARPVSVSLRLVVYGTPLGSIARPLLP